jgi:hypothetical protein
MNHPLADIIRGVMRGVDYHALYPAKVISQNSDDGSLELTPQSSKLAGMSRVPIRTGVPGMKVKVAAGGVVLVGFENGNPQSPVATLWDVTTCTELDLNGTIIKLNGGGTPVAKEGSITSGHTHTGTAGPYPVTLAPATDTIATGAGSPSIKVP